MSLGSWNDVPGHPDWYYGLSLRRGDGRREVVVYCKGRSERFGVEGRSWEEIHETASKKITEIEGGKE